MGRGARGHGRIGQDELSMLIVQKRRLRRKGEGKELG